MSSVTQNSHYIARHLTRPWEFEHPKYGRRQLWYYDCGRGQFGVESSRRLYTATTPWSREIEAFLNKYLETPLARFLNRFQISRREARPEEYELRAMKLALLLQLERSGVQGDLVETAKSTELELNALVSAADEVYAFVHIPLRAERLFFPAVGVVLLPLVGIAPAPALPLNPSYLIAALPRPVGNMLKQLELLRADEDNLTALSAGFRCRRIVLPGSLWGRHSDEQLARAIREAKTIARRLMASALERNREIFGTAFPTPRDWSEASRAMEAEALEHDD